eukprot:6202003-Pleurochrysis_carterae.AAC.1
MHCGKRQNAVLNTHSHLNDARRLSTGHRSMQQHTCHTIFIRMLCLSSGQVQVLAAPRDLPL